jgi:broad specificity phosphatase PhoE
VPSDHPAGRPVSVLLLVRHGQASFGAHDYDALSRAGLEQSRLLGASLTARGLVPTVVVSGGMRRHQGTAKVLLEGAGWDATVEVDEGWDEFDHQRIIEAHRPAYRNRTVMKADLARTLKPTRAFQDMFDQAVDRWVAGDHDGEYPESFADFAARVRAALLRTAGGMPGGGLAVVVTSGGPIGVVAAQLLTGHTAAWARFNRVTVNTGVTKVVAGERGLSCVSFNDHSHLDQQRRLLTYR